MRSVCIATFLFVKWMRGFKRKAGWLSLGLYMKTSSVCLMRFDGGSFEKHLPLPYPVSLTRSGLPGCIPAFHRRAISRRDEKADKLVKLYLSFSPIGVPFFQKERD
ncbi:hypothetical protein U1Q18_043942 [Sarracenia purpurea var. burkii]